MTAPHPHLFVWADDPSGSDVQWGGASCLKELLEDHPNPEWKDILLDWRCLSNGIFKRFPDLPIQAIHAEVVVR